MLCVPVAPASFVSKLPLPEEWRGLRGEELDAVTGVPGGSFVHHNGFTGGHKDKEGLMKMLAMTLEREQGIKKVRQE